MYKGKILEIKKRSWENFCFEGSSVKWGKLYKFISGKKSSKVIPATVLKNDGSYTSNIAETTEIMMDKFCPKDNPLDNLVIPLDNLDNFNVNDPDFSMIELQKAISKMNFKGAHGPDNITGQTWKQALTSLSAPFLNLCNSCLHIGYFPESWKLGKIITIPKSNQASSNVNLRPITLLDISAKIFERLIYSRISWLSEKGYWLSENQFGFREGKNTTKALLSIKEFLKDSFLLKKSALLLSFDITAAFDSVSHNVILNFLNKKCCPKNLYCLIRSYLNNRSSFLEYQDFVCRRTIVKGCPQGSILSPLLWNCSFNSIFDLHLPGEYKMVGYADDLSIILQSNSQKTLKQHSRYIISKVFNWGKMNKLSFNMDKLKCCLFSKANNFHLDPICWAGRRIPIQKEIKLLGVILDSKLSFRPHINHCLLKLNQITSRLMSTISKKFGPDPDFIKTCYTSLILPIISYWAPVWIEALRFKYISKKLNRLQRSWCLRITKSFFSAATLDIFAMVKLLPLKSYIELQCNRFHLKHTHHNYSPSDWPLLPSILPYPPTMSSIFHPHPMEEPDFYLFTDGSKTKEGVGTSFCTFTKEDLINPSHTFQESLDSRGSIFQAECFALLKAVNHISSLPKFSSILICSDNLSMINCLSNCNLTSELLLRIYHLLYKLKNSFRIWITWVKSHADCAGNNMADKLAKEAAATYISSNSAWSFQFQKIPPSFRFNESSHQAREKFITEYLASPHSKRLLMFMPNLMDIFSNKSLTFNSKTTSLILTGHGKLNAHLFRLNLDSGFTCRFCFEYPETIDHLVFECPALTVNRYHLYWNLQVLTDSDPKCYSSYLYNRQSWTLLTSFIDKLNLT